MPTAFERAHAFTARWEGGLVDHPDDPGGITNHGVSFRWVKELAEEARRRCLGEGRHCENCSRQGGPRCEMRALDMDTDGDVDADDIRACTKEQAAALFRRHFWDKLACDALPLPLAVTLYDGAVNMGPARAVRQLQAALNLVGENRLDIFEPLDEDGILGLRTREMAQAIARIDADFYTARQSLRQRDAFYRQLAARRPSMQAFLNGWRNRVKALGEYLAELEREV
ncbi:glycosyl hydrolase 108 family protein [uncultured Desulfovibrio sp.]|uniref:glycoside hydrolase family 108 protein n=1 Tax=uncultured Desulfovibrio sp. TaxID=167968 RepID=UPI00320A7E82